MSTADVRMIMQKIYGIFSVVMYSQWLPFARMYFAALMDSVILHLRTVLLLLLLHCLHFIVIQLFGCLHSRKCTK